MREIQMQTKKFLSWEINVLNFKEIKVINLYKKKTKNETALEQERSDKAKTTENYLRNKIIELDGLFNKEKENLFNITNEMNKQYKHMQDDLLKEINELKTSVKKKSEIIGLTENYR